MFNWIERKIQEFENAHLAKSSSIEPIEVNYFVESVDENSSEEAIIKYLEKCSESERKKLMEKIHAKYGGKF